MTPHRPAATTRAADPGSPEVASWNQQTFKDNQINLANKRKRRTTEKTNPPTTDDEPKANKNGTAHRAQSNQHFPPPFEASFCSTPVQMNSCSTAKVGAARAAGRGGDGRARAHELTWP